MQAIYLSFLLALGRFETTAPLNLYAPSKADYKVGAHKEISRYQIRPTLWRRYVKNPKAATNPEVSLSVTQKILDSRIKLFYSKYKRHPSIYEMYILWNAPNQIIYEQSGISRTVHTRAVRFVNLYETIRKNDKKY